MRTEIYIEHSAPSSEGAVVFRRKMTEGVILSLIRLTLLPQFRYAQQLPRRWSGFIFYLAAAWELNLISHTVGRWLAAAVKSHHINGCKQLYFYIIS